MTTTLYFVRSGLSWIIFVVFGLVLFFSAYNVLHNVRREQRGESVVAAKSSALAERLNLRGEYEDAIAPQDDRATSLRASRRASS